MHDDELTIGELRRLVAAVHGMGRRKSPRASRSRWTGCGSAHESTSVDGPHGLRTFSSGPGLTTADVRERLERSRR